MFDIIINPNSGKDKAKNALQIVETMLNDKQIPYKVHITNYTKHATDIVRELNQKPETKLIILGGDGTFNEVLNGITDFEKIAIGFIPCGTGNDYVRAASIPTDTKKALEIILKGNIGYTDFLQVGDKRCLNCAGAGMDVDVLERCRTMKLFRGKLKYYASLIDVLLHLRFHKMKVTIDGKTEEKSVFMIAVANGTCFGGGMRISPHSDVNDGKLNLVIINEIKPRKVLGILLKFLRGGKHILEPCTESYFLDQVKIELLSDGKTQIDGEVYSNKVLDCKIVHNTLRAFK
ncbi:MAG: diacylglycerol kinase family lipid kinase [Clostridiales bacterium]|nr:diacylglycerol kinase family lipid kinase [Clostridiales bacterium]